MWPENSRKCWRVPKWKSVHECSVFCSPDLMQHFLLPRNALQLITLQLWEAGQTSHQDIPSHPKSSRREWWPYCLLAIKFLPSRGHTSCSDLLEGDELSRKVRFLLASLFWKLFLDPSERSLCLNWLEMPTFGIWVSPQESTMKKWINESPLRIHRGKMHWGIYWAKSKSCSDLS